MLREAKATCYDSDIGQEATCYDSDIGQALSDGEEEINALQENSEAADKLQRLAFRLDRHHLASGPSPPCGGVAGCEEDPWAGAEAPALSWIGATRSD